MSQPFLRLLLVYSDCTAATRLLQHLGEEGYQVTLCLDVEQAATQLMPPAKWDLLVMDGSLGKLAQQLCLQVRSARTSIPILLLCPGATEADRVRGLEDGADDVLPSPFGLAECLARCRALVRRHQLGSESSIVLRCGRVSMLVEEHRVCRDGAEVTLSPREFRLLHFFLDHPGRIWSRDELLTRVWGENEALELDPKTVDVHIRWLRLKLEDDPAQPSLITTIRGQGYRCG
jgi:two-component system, OmpR family, phosphate regulon response regulator PhoB